MDRVDEHQVIQALMSIAVTQQNILKATARQTIALEMMYEEVRRINESLEKK